MNISKRKFSRLYLASSVVVAASVMSYSVSAETPPADARPLSAVELLSLYGDRTWVWAHGGAFFRSGNRTFRAYNEQEQTTAEGRFLLTNTGRLCLQADWHSPTGVYEDLTCFRHVRSGSTVYQQREDQDEWYVLAQDSQRPQSIVRGDSVSDGFTRIRQTATAH